MTSASERGLSATRSEIGTRTRRDADKRPRHCSPFSPNCPRAGKCRVRGHLPATVIAWLSPHFDTARGDLNSSVRDQEAQALGATPGSAVDRRRSAA